MSIYSEGFVLFPETVRFDLKLKFGRSADRKNFTAPNGTRIGSIIPFTPEDCTELKFSYKMGRVCKIRGLFPKECISN